MLSVCKVWVPVLLLFSLSECRAATKGGKLSGAQPPGGLMEDITNHGHPKCKYCTQSSHLQLKQTLLLKAAKIIILKFVLVKCHLLYN